MQAFLKSGKLEEFTNNPVTSIKLPRNSKPVPWVEKYRPRTVADVVEQNEVVFVLKQCIAGADLPNLLFYGPPGTGKTSTVLAAARQLFGDIYKERILELNASDERGIQVIRDKVKNFAQLTASGIRPDGKSCPPFKIIILDEADSMTHSAQAALRRMMEKESKSTRFCLICNYVSRIIEPLTSRCTKFRFKPLNESMIYERLCYICKEECIACDDSALNALVKTSGGDMRRAITCLQSCAKLKIQNEPINIDSVLEITGVIPECWLEEFLTVCKNITHNQLQEFIQKLLLEAYSAFQHPSSEPDSIDPFEKICQQCQLQLVCISKKKGLHLYCEAAIMYGKCIMGYSSDAIIHQLYGASKILEQFNEILVMSNEYNDKQKALIGEKLGIVAYRLQEGGSEYIQMLYLGNIIIKSYTLK